MATIYIEPLKSFINLLKDSFGAGQVKQFFEGDPILIGKSDLPAIACYKLSTANGFGPTGFDKVESQIMIKLILDKRDDFGASANVDLTEKKLRNFVEGRDETTGLYLEQTIMGTIRKTLTLNNDAFTLNPSVDQSVTVRYQVVARPEDMVTNEAHVTISLKEYLQIPNRI